MKIKIPMFGGGYYYDNQGKLRQYRMWWPIVFARYLDSFFRILVGKEPFGFMSTMTLVHRSGNSHTPKDQKITLVFTDADKPGRMIWGTDMSPHNARLTAQALTELAESIEPFFTLDENIKEAQRRINNEILKKQEIKCES